MLKYVEAEENSAHFAQRFKIPKHLYDSTTDVAFC